MILTNSSSKTLELTQHNPWALKAEIITAFSKLFLTDKYPCHLDTLPGSHIKASLKSTHGLGLKNREMHTQTNISSQLCFPLGIVPWSCAAGLSNKQFHKTTWMQLLQQFLEDAVHCVTVSLFMRTQRRSLSLDSVLGITVLLLDNR